MGKQRHRLENLLNEIGTAVTCEAKAYTMCHDFSLMEPDPKLAGTPDGLITEITMISDAVNVTLGVYIRASIAKELYARESKKPISEISDALAVDFVQELCNRCVGTVKRMFVDSGVFRKSNLFQTELPHNKSSSSGLDLSHAISSGLWDICWRLQSKERSIFFWVKIYEKLEDASVSFDNIKFSKNMVSDGDIDFL